MVGCPVAPFAPFYTELIGNFTQINYDPELILGNLKGNYRDEQY